MKKILVLIISLFLLTACSNSQEQITQNVNSPKTVDVILNSGDSAIINYDAEEVVININDSLTLELKGENETTAFCGDGCIVAKEITLNNKHLTLFENNSIPINSYYGSTRITRIDDLYILSFDEGAQIGGINSVIFDDKANILKEFNNVYFDLKAMSNDFVVYIPCEGDNCDLMKNPYSSFSYYTIDGSYLNEETHTIDETEINIIKQAAKNIESNVSVAFIGEAMNKSIDDVYYDSLYPTIYSFMNSIDESHKLNLEGRGLFCIIPTEDKATITIYNINPDDREEIFRSNDGKPILAISDYETVEVDVDGSKFMLEPIYGDTTLGTTLIHDFTYRNYSSENSIYYDVLLHNISYLNDYELEDNAFSETITIDENKCVIAHFSDNQGNKKAFAISEDFNSIYEFNETDKDWYPISYNGN